MTLQMPLFEAGTRSRSEPKAAKEDLLDDGFGLETFIANFEALATAAGGAAGLRRLVLDLAVRGRLTSPTALAQAADGPFAIPEHWAWGRGDEVFAFVTSGSRGWAAYYASDGPLFLRIGNLDYETTDLDLRNIQHVRPPKNAEGVRTRVEAGDILISITGDTGMVGLAPPNLGEAYINQHIALARPSAKVWPAFVARALTAPSLLGRLQSAQRGIKNSLGLDDVRTMTVPVPPLAEQKRIVARVDQLMALIDDLEAKQTKKRDISSRFTKASLEALTSADSPEAFDTAWERVLGELSTVLDRSEKVADLRRAIRDLAVSGRLVGDVNGASAIDTRADGAFPIPKRWSWCPLGELAMATAYGTSQKAHEEPDGVPVLRMNNIQETRLDLTSLKYVPPETEKLDELMLAQGDLLFNRTNSYELVGKMAVFREAGPFTFASYLIRVRLNLELAVPEYVNLYFASSVCRRTQIEPNITVQTNQANFNGTKLKEIAVPTPGVDEQKRIVAKVEHLMKLCDELEAKLRRAEDRASKLVEAVVQEMVA